MPKYILTVTSIITALVSVEADTPEEAGHLVSAGIDTHRKQVLEEKVTVHRTTKEPESREELIDMILGDEEKGH